MAVATLLCAVRGCRLPLTREERRLTCPTGHSFDIARSGYVNLLQPHDKRSRRPGDSAEVLAARRRVLAGVEARLIADLVGVLAIAAGDAVLDVGCGEGHHLAVIAERFRCAAHGIDISVSAIDAAARSHREIEWIVANADRLVPYADGSFSLVASITGRLNPGEFRRVVREDGTLLVAVPAPDDLVELRQAVLGKGVLRDRVERTVAAFAPRFALERRERICHVARLDAPAVADVMTSAYRALRARERARLTSVGETEVTHSRDVLIFRPR